MTYSFLILSSLCTNTTESNNTYSVCLQCCHFVLPSCQFLAAFFKSLFSPHGLQPLFGNFLISFLVHTFKNILIFKQNSIFVTEAHVYTKILTPNHRLLPSNMRSVSKKVSSKLTKEVGPIIYHMKLMTFMIHRL